MLRTSLSIYILCFFCLNGFSQKDYFQQRVDYKMDLVLDDKNHTISAFQQIKYVNNSSQSLGFIYFHLWPNAYKNNSTALAKQLLRQGNTELYYSKPHERGFIDSLDFRVNGKTVTWELDKEHIDICKVILNEPLQASDSIVITTPFFLKIPDAKFSRLGHTGQAYYITQWYPKPAVFDNRGWHPMPYLDQGEFYSEYGSFDVSVTLPDNYVLCATGDRVFNPDEEDFLKKRIEETSREVQRIEAGGAETTKESFVPVSSKLVKTIQFKQTQVHDFAWFADKRFYVMRSDFQLPKSEAPVTAWTYFTPENARLWKDAINYVKRSTLFYSKCVGEYPYRNVSAVDGNIMAGGGMEYPNITVIGEASSAMELDMVITHEVGHNWFYGILGSNERDYPFLDEGLNSFIELRYIRETYPSNKISEFLGKDSSIKWFNLHKIPLWKFHEISFYATLRKGIDQAVSLSAEEYTESNYGSSVYSKSALVFDYLMDYMGEHVMDQALQTYFETYKFKHPDPNDLFKTLNLYSGKDLREFQKHLIYSTDRIDYKIKSVTSGKDGNYVLTLKNKTKTTLPFNIYAYDKDNRVLAVTWLDGFEKKRKVTITAAAATRFKIDGADRMPDIYRKNNHIKTQGILKKSRPLGFKFLTAFEQPQKAYMYYLPIAAGNTYNGFMPGIGLHNYGFYEKRFEYLIAPMFAFNTKTPVGFAEFNTNLYPKNVFSRIVIGAKTKTFAYDMFDTERMNTNTGREFSDLYLNYYKITPYLQFEIKKRNPLSPISQIITYSSNNLFTDSLDTRSYNSYAITGPKKKNTYTFVNQFTYDFVNSRSFDPFTLRIELQHTAAMAKMSATLNYKVTLGKNKYFDIRFFAGVFLAGNIQQRSYYAFRAAGYNGWHDYLFEGNYAARNVRNGFGFSQFMERDGALKVWTPLGQSPEWLTSLNVKTPKIFRLPLKLFADAVVCDPRALNNDAILWDAGVNLVLWNDVIDVYLPLFYNPDIKRTLNLNHIDFLNTIRFTFNIHKLAPKNILQNTLF